MPNVNRPGTLAEVVSRAVSGEQALTVALNEFLDVFLHRRRSGQPCRAHR